MKRAAAGAIATFVVALGYFSLFRSYGFQIEDEGTLLFQLDRVIRGQVPYVDFHTGYTPGFFRAGATLLEAAGGSVVALRTMLAVLNAATAAGLYVVARRVAGAWTAAIAPALWVAFIPVYGGDFAAFNIPYPAWFATITWVATAAAMLAWSTRGGLAWLVAAGLAIAAAFSIKINAGAFALAACTWITSTTARDQGVVDRVAAAGATSLMALGVWFAFGFAVATQDVVVHLLACLALVVLALGPHAHRFATPDHPRALIALTVLAVSFAVPTALWALPLLARLGIEGFAGEVLLIGSGASALYYEEHPPPEPYALLVTAALVFAIAGGRLVMSGRLRPLLVFTAAAVIAVVAVPLAARRVLMPEGLLVAIAQQLENSGFWLAPLANICAVVMLVAMARRRGEDAVTRALAVLVPLAVAMYLQLYPRTDFMHVVMAVPLTAVIGSVVLERVAGWWAAGAWPDAIPGRRAMAVVVSVGIVGVVALRLALVVPNALAARETVVEAGTRIDALGLEPSAADDLRAFRMTARYVAANTSPGENVLTFPAVAGVLFAAARTSPVPHDYWYPGRPDHVDERAMLARLAADPPRYIVTLNAGWTFFIDSPGYFLAARDFARARYRLVARYGRFDVLARNDVAGSTGVDLWQPGGPRRDAIEANMAERRQAMSRWKTALSFEETTPESLPADVGEAVLLLRAVRDAGDMRAAGLIVGGAQSRNPRVRNEARGAMLLVAAGFRAAVDRWAGDLPLDEYSRFARPYVEDARRLSTDPDPEVVRFASSLMWMAQDDAVSAQAGGVVAP